MRQRIQIHLIGERIDRRQRVAVQAAALGNAVDRHAVQQMRKDAHIRANAAIFLLVLIICDQAQRKVLGRLVEQLDPHRLVVFIVEMAVGIGVVYRAVALVAEHGQANGDGIIHWAGNIALELPEAVIADAGLAIRPVGEGR